MKIDARLMLLRMENPCWSDEDLMQRIKDSMRNPRMGFHCDDCGGWNKHKLKKYPLENTLFRLICKYCGNGYDYQFLR